MQFTLTNRELIQMENRFRTAASSGGWQFTAERSNEAAEAIAELLARREQEAVDNLRRAASPREKDEFLTAECARIRAATAWGTVKPCELMFNGLQCDAAGCDFAGLEVDPTDAANIGRPCPKCGASLLTLEDFATIQRLIAEVAIINAESIDLPPSGKQQLIDFVMDGTGSISVREATNAPQEALQATGDAAPAREAEARAAREAEHNRRYMEELEKP